MTPAFMAFGAFALAFLAGLMFDASGKLSGAVAVLAIVLAYGATKDRS